MVRVAAEERARDIRPRLLHRFEPFEIARDDIVLRRDEGDEAPGESGGRAGVGDPVERPGPLAQALQQAGLDQHLEVAGDARLALAQDCRQVADRQLASRAQGQDAKPRRLCHSPQPLKQLIHLTFSPP